MCDVADAERETFFGYAKQPSVLKKQVEVDDVTSTGWELQPWPHNVLVTADEHGRGGEQESVRAYQKLSNTEVAVEAEGQKQNAQRHSHISERCSISATPLDGARAAFFKLKPHSTQHRAAFA